MGTNCFSIFYFALLLRFIWRICDYINKDHVISFETCIRLAFSDLVDDYYHDIWEIQLEYPEDNNNIPDEKRFYIGTRKYPHVIIFLSISSLFLCICCSCETILL